MLTSTKWEYKSLHCCSPQNKVIILLLSCQCKEPGTAERGGGGGGGGFFSTTMALYFCFTIKFVRTNRKKGKRT